MKEFKGTPGPWFFGVEGEGGKIHRRSRGFSSNRWHGNPGIYANGGKVKIVGCDEYYVFSGRENVSLLVAAPDLLEALQLMLDDYMSDKSNADYEFDIEKKARAAIAKALGD